MGIFLQNNCNFTQSLSEIIIEMKNKIEYFFDCSSPWTYLAFKGITDLSKKDFELIWKPILVGGIFNTTNPSVYEARNNPNPVKKIKILF